MVLRIDLHTHTTASDGLLSPSDLVASASQRGIDVLGVTDHDTLNGHTEALAAGVERGVDVVPGVELSTRQDGVTTHMLGYWVQSGTVLDRTLAELIEARRDRIERIISRLQEIGLPLSPLAAERILSQNAPGRPHVAHAMMDAGYVSSIGEAFERYLSGGRPAYIPKDAMLTTDAVHLILQSGGVPVLAHPLTPGTIPELPVRLKLLKDAGLQGMEAYYAKYDAATRKQLVNIAESFDLVATGGSDYHGDGVKEGPTLGEVLVPESSYFRLRELAGKA